MNEKIPLFVEKAEFRFCGQWVDKGIGTLKSPLPVQTKRRRGCSSASRRRCHAKNAWPWRGGSWTRPWNRFLRSPIAILKCFRV